MPSSFSLSITTQVRKTLFFKKSWDPHAVSCSQFWGHQGKPPNTDMFLMTSRTLSVPWEQSDPTWAASLLQAKTSAPCSPTDCSSKIYFKLLMCTYLYWQFSHVFTLGKDTDITLLIFSTSVFLFGPVWLLVLFQQIEMLPIFERNSIA